MSDSNVSRRKILELTGASLLTAGTAATGGCMEALSIGQQVPEGSVTMPKLDKEPSSPVYRRWMPAASALPDDDHLQPGWVNYAMPKLLTLDVDGDGESNATAEVFQKPHVDYFGVGYRNFDRVIGLHDLGMTFVLEGDLDRSVISDTLTDSGYTEADSYAGYDLFERTDGPRTAAVSESAIVWARHEKARAVVEAVVDAGRGVIDRHHETDSAFAELTDAIGARRWSWVGGLTLDPSGNALVGSMSFTFDDKHVYYRYDHLYPDGAVPSEEAFRETVADNSRAIDAQAVDIELTDRMASVRIRLSYEDVQNDYDGVTVPQITWGVSVDGDQITIRHEAGQSTPAETITFYAEGDEERSPTGTQFIDDHDVIEPGNSITVTEPQDSGTSRIVGQFSPNDSQSTSRFVIYRLP